MTAPRSSARRRRRTGDRFRRSPFLVGHWISDRLVLTNYVRNEPISCSADDVAILDALATWSSADEVAHRLTQSPAETRRRLARFRRHGIVETLDDPLTRAEHAARGWEPWTPAAAWFHQSSKDVRFARPEIAQRSVTRQQEVLALPPARNRSARSGPPRALPPFPRRGSLPQVLLARRTWRQYGKGALSLRDFSALLGLTWGVQQWLQATPSQRLPLKTSPSGGACHCIEAYALVLAVDGLTPGIYHYDADLHALRWVCRSGRRAVARFLPSQPAFSRAAAIFFMTAVFSRVQWKYRFARAYRVVLLEAGHLCQTFCLTATWLGLSPFCTAALGDTAFERAVDIDGIGESVLYAAGVGVRPAGSDWAPYEDGYRPPLVDPAWNARAHKDRR